MNRIHLAGTATLMMFALAMLETFMLAQPAATKPAGGEQSSGLPTADEQLKVLNAKLNLTAHQQAKVKPILEELHDATEKLAHDKSLTPEQQLEKVRPLRRNAGEKIREILTDDQKTRFEEYLKGPHAELHGNLRGGAKSK